MTEISVLSLWITLCSFSISLLPFIPSVFIKYPLQLKTLKLRNPCMCYCSEVSPGKSPKPLSCLQFNQKNGVATKKQRFSCISYSKLKIYPVQSWRSISVKGEIFWREFSPINYWIRRSNLPSSQGSSDKQNTGMASLRNGLIGSPRPCVRVLLT